MEWNTTDKKVEEGGRVGESERVEESGKVEKLSMVTKEDKKKEIVEKK